MCIRDSYSRLADAGVDVIDDGSGHHSPPEDDYSEEEAFLTKLDLSIDHSAGDPVRLYLKEIGKVHLLAAAEEISLARRVQARDVDAKRRLTEANLRLVVSLSLIHI